MKIGISLKLDVTKIDKARLFKGEKGTYLDLTTFVDLDNVDQYGNSGFITQSPTKEERQQKLKMPILGNVTVFFSDKAAAPEPSQPDSSQFDGFDDDIPFNQIPL